MWWLLVEVGAIHIAKRHVDLAKEVRQIEHAFICSTYYVAAFHVYLGTLSPVWLSGELAGEANLVLP